MVNDDSSLSSPSALDVDKDRRSRRRNEELSQNKIVVVMNSLTDLCNNNKTSSNIGKGVGDSIKRESVVMIENLLMTDLYTIIEHHKLHIQFLKDNDMLFDDKKSSIIDKIKNIFKTIESRSGERKRECSPPPVIMMLLVKK